MNGQHNPRRVWPRVALLLAILIAAGAALWYWREPLWDLFGNQEHIQAWLAQLGPWAPLVTIGLNAAQVLLAPIPGAIIGVANGYLYGVWLGTLYSMIGLALGTALAMGLARRLGRPLVERLVNPARLDWWDHATQRRGPVFFFLIYLVPGLPDDLICFVVGLSRLPLLKMVGLALLGRLPGVLVSSWVGAYATALPVWVWIPLGGGTAGLAWLYYRYHEQVQTALLRFIGRLTGQRTQAEEAEPGPVEEERQAHP